MKEELITFETAKLAKTKEFDIPVLYGVYGKKMKLTREHSNNFSNWNKKERKSWSIPTQSLLQKWLRDNHKIHIMFMTNTDLTYNYSVVKLNIGVGHRGGWNDENDFDFLNYEEALEKGLQEGLKLIKP